MRSTLVDPIAAATSKGKMLVSVTLPNFAASVAGLLEPGDVVTLMYTARETQVQQLGVNPVEPQSASEPRGKLGGRKPGY